MMRKIVSKEEEERKRKRNQTILVIILGAVMILSTLGFALQSGGNVNTTPNPGSVVDYHGFKFINQNGLWSLGNFTFTNTPYDIVNQTTANVSLGLKPMSSYQGLPVYLYSQDVSSESEAATTMALVAQRVQRACPETANCSSMGDLPVKTCSDNFIIIEASNSSSITQDNNCIYIRGPEENLVALTDQFLFKALGVM